MHHFATTSQARDALAVLLQEGDVVLVKGSQNTLFLERIVENLLANPAESKLLPRRGAYWDQERANSA